jgi:hypothetical protein
MHSENLAMSAPDNTEAAPTFDDNLARADVKIICLGDSAVGKSK